MTMTLRCVADGEKTCTASCKAYREGGVECSPVEPAATPGVPGAVGAGSAVKALADELEEADLSWTCMSCGASNFAQVGYILDRLRAAIAQDADRTSRGGALNEDELTRLAATACVEVGLSPRWCEQLGPVLARRIDLAARVTRPAPDDQPEDA